MIVFVEEHSATQIYKFFHFDACNTDEKITWICTMPKTKICVKCCNVPFLRKMSNSFEMLSPPHFQKMCIPLL